MSSRPDASATGSPGPRSGDRYIRMLPLWSSHTVTCLLPGVIQDTEFVGRLPES